MSQITATKILEKLENIDARVTRLLTKLEIKKEQQDEHRCGKDEHWDDEKQMCVADFPCDEGEHWDEEQQKCVPDIPKTESTTLKGEGLTHATNYEATQATEELQKQWEKEDAEMSENPTVNES